MPGINKCNGWGSDLNLFFTERFKKYYPRYHTDPLNKATD